jgi:uncharacterized lipoprotein YehR (DUF1307 family)
MKKFLSILAIAILSVSSMSCRQEDETETFNSQNTTEKTTFKKSGDTIKTDTIKVNHKPVDPDPPVKDGTSW